jgi:Fe2+ transport system protein FeoA
MLNNFFRRRRRHHAAHPHVSTPASLASFPGGSQVRVTAFGNLTMQYLQHLQAYGILPGRTLKILAQHPLTIVLVEQTELALEDSVAAQVFVELA